MSLATEQRKLAAIMFTDMVGYSALAQRNEALALELLEEHRRVVRGLLPGHGGREVKTTGDGFLLEFPSALAAVQAAVEIQNALHERNQVSPPERRFRIRIGIHVGDVVMKDGDIHGDGVNIAARIEPLAGPGGICISSAVHEQVRNKLSQPMAALGPAELKNIDLPVVVHRVVLPWEKQAATNIVRKGPAPGRRTARPMAFAIVVALLLGGVGWWVWRERDASSSSHRQTGRITSLAVKPLDDFSGDTNNAYLSDGMTEALCSALGNVSALRVPGRASVMRYKGGQKSIREMGKELVVDAVVEGSVQRAGSRLLITVQLIEAATDRHLWSTNYERDLGEFFKVQSEVARAIAEEVRVRLTPDDQARLARSRAVKPEALDAALKGRFHFLKYSMAGVSNALVYFQKAIELDPTYAPAHSGLADCYGYSAGQFMSPREAWPKAKAHVQRALELDDSLADAYASRGMHRIFADWDWKGAEEDLLHALKLSPNAAYIHDLYSMFLGNQGRFDEALAQNRRAIELEPLVPAFRANQALWHYAGRDYPQAIARAREALEIDANSFAALAPLGWAYLVSGRTNEALQAFEKCALLEPDNPVVKMFLACGEVGAGRRAEAVKRIEELDALSKERYVAPMLHAYFHTVARETNEALRYIERALDERDAWIMGIKVDPVFDTLRSHPRFQAVLKKINFPP